MPVTKALVLSGGGYAGEAWMLGLIDALRGHGVDLLDADLIVGTSAGARVGVQLSTGTLADAIDKNRRPDAAPPDVPVAMDDFVAASMRILSTTDDQRTAAKLIANLPPIGPRLGSGDDRRRAVAARLPTRQWPTRRLIVTAVDAESGDRIAFDASSGVDLLDAVLASGALPGVYPLVSINGHRYADGGAHSVYNADLATGHDVVAVLSPMPLNSYLTRLLDAETAALGEARVRIITADEAALAAIGGNPLSPHTGPAALDAGSRQATREIDTLRRVWPGHPARRAGANRPVEGNK
jgi:NTE family protein